MKQPGRIFIEFETGKLYEKLVNHLKFHLDRTILTITCWSVDCFTCNNSSLKHVSLWWWPFRSETCEANSINKVSTYYVLHFMVFITSLSIENIATDVSHMKLKSIAFWQRDSPMLTPGILIQCKNSEIGLARFTNFVRYVNRALGRIISFSFSRCSVHHGVN
jgi:hypothetical protein